MSICLSLRTALKNSSRFLLKNSPSCTQLKFSTNNAEASTQQTPDKMDGLKSNPYFSKYEAKLKNIYNENPQAFLSALKNKKPEKIGDGPMSDIKNSKMEFSLTKKKTLNSIMKTEMLTDLPKEEIKNIWTTYMKERSRLADILNLDEYKKITERAKTFNTFLFPMPREQGYEFILAQWSSNECHFTPLINFQAHGENAPSTMTMIFFDELKDSKEIILEMAEIDTQHLKMEEARLLLRQMKDYYLKSEDSDEKFNLMNCFTSKPTEFKHMDLIKQLEKDNLKLENFKE